jgi:hypothetical protein
VVTWTEAGATLEIHTTLAATEALRVSEGLR